MSWLDRLKSSLGLNSTETEPANLGPASIAYSMPTVAASVTNKLWKCPLHVDRGCYQEMPAEWLGAAVNVYIGAETYEEALTKAVHFPATRVWFLLTLLAARSRSLIQIYGGMDMSWPTTLNTATSFRPNIRLAPLSVRVWSFTARLLAGIGGNDRLAVHAGRSGFAPRLSSLLSMAAFGRKRTCLRQTTRPRMLESAFDPSGPR